MKIRITLACIIAFASTLLAQTVPSLMNYQGRLTDEAGTPLPDGTYRLAFRLHSNAVFVPSETLIWGREYEATVLGGVFNVVLGATGGGEVEETPAVSDLTFAFSEPNRFLELRIVRDAAGNITPRTILPRQQLLSSPYAFTAASLIKEFQEALNPPGTIVAYGGSNIPDGWLLCDGRALSSSQHPRLFAAIGTGWGSGIPSTTNNFNLPDLRGLFLRGVNNGRNDGYQDADASSRTNSVPIGRPSTGGLVSGNPGPLVGSLQLDQLPSHRHRWGVVGTESTPRERTLRTWNIGGSLFTFLYDNSENNLQSDNDSPHDNFKEAGPSGASLYTDPASTFGVVGQTYPRNAAVNYIIKY